VCIQSKMYVLPVMQTTSIRTRKTWIQAIHSAALPPNHLTIFVRGSKSNWNREDDLQPAMGIAALFSNNQEVSHAVRHLGATATDFDADLAALVTAFNQAQLSLNQHAFPQVTIYCERAVTLLIELVHRCEGLDGADPELGRYALDLHELGLKNIIVARDDPTRIVRAFPYSPSEQALNLPPRLLFLFFENISRSQSWIGSPHLSDRCGAVLARRTGSCPHSQVTTTPASSACAACSARRSRVTRSLHAPSTRTIPATR
jgi:hypothetical protein